jgi:hypothetical protein
VGGCGLGAAMGHMDLGWVMLRFGTVTTGGYQR